MAFNLELCLKLQAIPGEWTGNLDKRIYIITDVLLASAVSTEHTSNGSLDVGVDPLAVAALAHGVPLSTHTPEVSLKVGKISKEGEHVCDVFHMRNICAVRLRSGLPSTYVQQW